VKINEINPGGIMTNKTRPIDIVPNWTDQERAQFYAAYGHRVDEECYSDECLCFANQENQRSSENKGEHENGNPMNLNPSHGE
jgi:hypothetical protein